jgi:hypothetical protein
MNHEPSFRVFLGEGGEAMRATRIGWQAVVVLTALVSLWLALTGLLFVSWGNPEAFLLGRFGRYSRSDAFVHLNPILPFFWFVHSSMLLMAIAAARSRRTDVLTVLLIGPVITLVFNLFYQEWSDPDWYDLVALLTIGWLVSTIVGGGYWMLKPTARLS